MSSDSPSRHVRIRFWVKCALHDYLGSRLPYRIPDPPRPMMLGYRGLNLHLKNFADTIHARLWSVEKHQPKFVLAASGL